MRVRAIEGQVLDGLLWRHYDYQKGVLELVLNPNLGLAAQGAKLSASVYSVNVIAYPKCFDKPRSKTRLMLDRAFFR
ncbi:tail protein X [Enterovibrio norvegicus]|uniref:tail protein X n=1 Tax=Enterovibrio norvegicus TaxID=188144 RepID=UPI0013D003E7